LRFLALTVLELDPNFGGLLCLEEPENGIHPERIPAMLKLLQDIVTDPNEPAGPNNPLRQAIVNTHSPAVVGQVPESSLLSAELRESVRDGRRFRHLSFSCLPGTWREATGCPAISIGSLLAYLNPMAPAGHSELARSTSQTARSRRVVDRPDLQLELFGG
jgi:hypothetical protein